MIRFGPVAFMGAVILGIAALLLGAGPVGALVIMAATFVFVKEGP